MIFQEMVPQLGIVIDVKLLEDQGEIIENLVYQELNLGSNISELNSFGLASRNLAIITLQNSIGKDYFNKS